MITLVHRNLAPIIARHTVAESGTPSLVTDAAAMGIPALDLVVFILDTEAEGHPPRSPSLGASLGGSCHHLAQQALLGVQAGAPVVLVLVEPLAQPCIGFDTLASQVPDRPGLLRGLAARVALARDATQHNAVRERGPVRRLVEGGLIHPLMTAAKVLPFLAGHVAFWADVVG